MKRKKWPFVLLIVIVVLGIAGYAAIRAFIDKADENLKLLTEAQIRTLDLTAVADGTYTGSFKAFPIEVEVEVEVKGHKILSIALIRHSNGKGQAAEVLPDQVVAAQSLQVDTIAGATYSSKSILLAIQDALGP
ncbi:MAG: FMN-binding protein [Clostridiaceae bacterium]|nr:FMN-binding protein [Clostridiaceae bacterium]